MSFGPACERCGACSYEGSMDDRPIKCPFCHKYKKRGSREELIAALFKAKLALAMSAGFLHGGSIANKETVLLEIREAFKTAEDV